MPGNEHSTPRMWRWKRGVSTAASGWTARSWCARWPATPEKTSGERLEDLHTRYYRETASLLRPLPGAQELLKRVADLGLQVVLATSAPEDELAILRKVLACDDVISEVTSSGDVDTAKPEPDIVEVALGRAHVTPSVLCSSVMRCGMPRPAPAHRCPASACSAAGSAETSWKLRAPQRFSRTRWNCSSNSTTL